MYASILLSPLPEKLNHPMVLGNPNQHSKRNIHCYKHEVFVRKQTTSYVSSRFMYI